MADFTVTVGSITIKVYTEEYFGMKRSMTARYFFMIIGPIVGFRVLALIYQRYINHQKRYGTIKWDVDLQEQRSFLRIQTLNSQIKYC
ncbi:hypothetical protein PC128_g25290 [Phytophthora cactorum]|nr:hypothetical protein PC128_g25290 [Phytophthora cactorum]KAG4037090.1 hypothetical protein PC123_g27343 [Phytophthora cactorum]